MFARSRRWLARRPLLPILALVAAGLLVLVLDVLPSALVGPDAELTTAERLKAENDVRTTLIQALGGAILLFGLYFTGRTYVLNREGQVTERFTHAIDQLGNVESLDVRLGGIYALERIAQESRRDHWPIVEVLTAFVREHSRRTPLEGESVERNGLTGTDQRRPAADVQAVLTVLGRRKREQEGQRQRLSLEKTELSGADLGEAHLEGAYLFGVRLEGAYLYRAHLERADLLGAHLENANLSGADLKEARLYGAHLKSANLGDAHLENANLGGAHLENANLGRAHLEGANLAEARLYNANLRGAHLENANLSGARLEGAEL